MDSNGASSSMFYTPPRHAPPVEPSDELVNFEKGALLEEHRRSTINFEQRGDEQWPNEDLFDNEANLNGRPLRRPVYLDISNIARSACHQRLHAAYSGLFYVVAHFIRRGYNVHGFTPTLSGIQNNDQGVDTELLIALEKLKLVTLTPARRVGNMTVVNYDDLYILEQAERNGGVVVSNDRYTDVTEAYPGKYERAIDRRLLVDFVDNIDYMAAIHQEQGARGMYNRRFRLTWAKEYGEHKGLLDQELIDGEEDERMLCYPGDTDYRQVMRHQMTDACRRHILHLLARIKDDWCRSLLPLNFVVYNEGRGYGERPRYADDNVNEQLRRELNHHHGRDFDTEQYKIMQFGQYFSKCGQTGKTAGVLLDALRPEVRDYVTAGMPALERQSTPTPLSALPSVRPTLHNAYGGEKRADALTRYRSRYNYT